MQGVRSVMKFRNEIEQFIYEFCYQEIWKLAFEYIYMYPLILDLSYSRIKYPDTALLESMIPEYTTNISIDGDNISFDMIANCVITLTEDRYNGIASHDLSQWLSISCKAKVTDSLENIEVTGIRNYKEASKVAKNQEFTPNIVPIIKKEMLDEEATCFLETYCPEVLLSPMAVPIDKIVKLMNLEVIKDFRLTEDFDIFGEICFSPGSIDVFDLFKCGKNKIEVRRGTILVDAYTFWERTQGCVNNTIVHELYHWHRHRMYASIRQLLRNESFIACRCPASMTYPTEENKWTDEERMEWQANNVTPRILMPIQTFVPATKVLYEKYDYANTPLKVPALTCIADELAVLYKVSRQSVLIRMKETGFPEANIVLNKLANKYQPNTLSIEEAFLEYTENATFRNVLDSGNFIFVDGYFVLNDSKYISISADDTYSLTEYAWEHLDECTLRLSAKKVRNPNNNVYSAVIMHRDTGSGKVPQYDEAENQKIIQAAKDLEKAQAIFTWQNEVLKLLSPSKTCCEMIRDIIDARGWNNLIFESRTLLGTEVYSKAMNGKLNKPNVRTITAFACGYDLSLSAVEFLLRSSGQSFDMTFEHQALQFCISGLVGQPIKKRNEFLIKNNIEPLGTKQRK